jgi:hypothetical protein
MSEALTTEEDDISQKPTDPTPLSPVRQLVVSFVACFTCSSHPSIDLFAVSISSPPRPLSAGGAVMAGEEGEKANGGTTAANGSLGATTTPPSTSGSNNGHTSTSSTSNNDVKREEEKEKIFFRRIRDGFTYLRDLRDAGHNKSAILAAPLPHSVLPPFLNSVNVNFIDPTTSSITTTSMSGISSSGGNKPAPQQRLYEKFSTIFQREFHNSINHVPYQLIRNNSHGIIENLPLATTVARSHGGGVLLMPSSYADNNDDAARSALNDYSWERPYCHVYLAACESLEHYRTKVKPSIQAFVSQLEASGKQTTTPSRQSSFNENALSSSSPTKTMKQQQQRQQQQRHTPQARYVVIYVPTGDRSSSVTATAGDGNTFGTRQGVRMDRDETSCLAMPTNPYASHHDDEDDIPQQRRMKMCWPTTKGFTLPSGQSRGAVHE